MCTVWENLQRVLVKASWKLFWSIKYIVHDLVKQLASLRRLMWEKETKEIKEMLLKISFLIISSNSFYPYLFCYVLLPSNPTALALADWVCFTALWAIDESFDEWTEYLNMGKWNNVTCELDILTNNWLSSRTNENLHMWNLHFHMTNTCTCDWLLFACGLESPHLKQRVKSGEIAS